MGAPRRGRPARGARLRHYRGLRRDNASPHGEAAKEAQSAEDWLEKQAAADRCVSDGASSQIAWSYRSATKACGEMCRKPAASCARSRVHSRDEGGRQNAHA